MGNTQLKYSRYKRVRTRIKPLLSEVIEQNGDENDEVAIAITNTTEIPDTILQRNTFVTQIRKPLDKKQCIMMCKKVKKMVHFFSLETSK